ncbi:MAG: hypothetical protein BYD32DRAFT_430434 [Podila humilis]|nr:MAG: hypothetical protein BYD32DRAFT_430434 [Podila humilis]
MTAVGAEAFQGWAGALMYFTVLVKKIAASVKCHIPPDKRRDGCMSQLADAQAIDLVIPWQSQTDHADDLWQLEHFAVHY